MKLKAVDLFFCQPLFVLKKAELFSKQKSLDRKNRKRRAQGAPFSISQGGRWRRQGRLI
ncbi:hypothetical protein CLOLEP_00435 [[Clostridium] leptum DSM 753]|jgi:hypothetical protein|uniref:Uncharacterized protein n=1 Tax=[Clostridium] leptum DSM 753 TaxID=428125 RepID=A7VPF9_9FIRM|nr:hypothetical protein CLOLEP_00435 [[Clostridium] leptum DSM 753]